MIFTHVVSVNDILEFIRSRGWTAGKIPIVLKSIDGEHVCVRVHLGDIAGSESEALLRKYLDENEPARCTAMLDFSARRIKPVDGCVRVSKETQREWRAWVEGCKHNRRMKRKAERANSLVI